MSPRPKAYSYLRFSSPEQAKGDSLRRQIEMAERYAAEHDLDLDGELTFRDLGVSAFSGKNAKSGALGAFRRAVEDGAVAPGSYLLVENLDRVSRQSPRKALRALEEIVDEGVIVVTLTDGRVHSRESIDDALGLMGVLFTFMRANEESATKAKRLRAVWTNKRRQAKEQGTRATAAGPDWLTASEDGFSIVEDRASIIRRIFAETIQGEGQHRIAQRLTREGVPTWRGAKVWHRTYVRKVLENPAVIGTAVFHETERLEGGGHRRRPVQTVPGYFPPVIDEKTWGRARSVLGSRAEAGALRRGRHAATPLRHLLANLARCPHCDGTMTRVNKGAGNGRAYLVCAGAKAGNGCSYRGVHVAAVDAAVFDRHLDLCREPPGSSDREAELRDDLRNTRAIIDIITSELEDLDRARRTRQFAPAMARRAAELIQEQEGLEARVETLEGALAATASPIVMGRVSRLWALLEAGEGQPLEPVNAVLRECFDAVTVDYAEGVLRFRWRQGGQTVISYGNPFVDETKG